MDDLESIAECYGYAGGVAVYPEERRDTVRGFPGDQWASYGFFLISHSQEVALFRSRN
ncbi:MAG: hypothetical protein WC359_12915 [Dehalococcoidia bacterium]|jgi:hypothetical protein